MIGVLRCRLVKPWEPKPLSPARLFSRLAYGRRPQKVG